jgi:hypothetical protein
MGSRGLAHHGTPAVKFSSPSICTLSTMAGKNSNTKYYDCDWWLDDRYTANNRGVNNTIMVLSAPPLYTMVFATPRC